MAIDSDGLTMWIKNTDLVEIARAALERHDNMILALRIIHDEHPDYNIKSGEYCRPSYRWEDGECTDEVLDGTSAIDARMLSTRPIGLRQSYELKWNYLIIAVGLFGNS